jgi:hypothetical protein
VQIGGVEDTILQACIDDLEDCARICQEAFAYCLVEGEEYAEPDTVQLLIDCGEACALAARWIARQSMRNARACRLAGEVADLCAEACGDWPDDRLLFACAEVCRRTAASCRRVVLVA